MGVLRLPPSEGRWSSEAPGSRVCSPPRCRPPVLLRVDSVIRVAGAECSDDSSRCLSRRTPAVTAGMKNKRQAQTRWLMFSTTGLLNVSPAAASDDAPAAPRLFQRLESSLDLWSGGTSRSYHLAPFKTPESYLNRQRRVSARKTLAVFIGLSLKWRPC